METLCRLSYRGNAEKPNSKRNHNAIPVIENDITTSLYETVAGEGFEPPKHEASDLQSDPFGRSGNLPYAEKIGAVEE